MHIGINTVTYIPCTKLLSPDSNNLQEDIHHGDTENTETLKFFVCRETTANENRPSCLRQEQGALFFSEGILFLPVAVSRRAKNCYPPRPPRLCGENMAIKDMLPQLSMPVSTKTREVYFPLLVCTNTPSQSSGGGASMYISQRSAMAREAPSSGQSARDCSKRFRASSQNCCR